MVMSEPWVALPAWLTGAIGTQVGLVAAPSMLANPNGAMQPVGTGPFRGRAREAVDGSVLAVAISLAVDM